jgi:hypothetical protein
MTCFTWFGDTKEKIMQLIISYKMEEYIDYLKGKIEECNLEGIHISVSVYQEVLDTYLSFLDAAKLKTSKKSITVAGSRQSGKTARFAELYGMIRPAVHIMVGSKEMHDNMEKALSDAVDHVKNAPIQGRFAEAFERERGITINESMARDNTILLTSLPKMTKPLLPLDKHGQPLENPRSRFHK